MSLNFNLCGSLCENLFLTFKCCKQAEKKSVDKDIKYVIDDINLLLAGPTFSKKFICSHILNKLVQLTGSEYGFIGKIVEEKSKPVLYTYAITNIAWNAASHKFFIDHVNSSLRFENMDTLFGEVITSGKYKIINKYDATRNILPDGHPLTKRFLGVPSIKGGKSVAFLGVCNKIGKYTKKDVNKVSRILDILAYLFIDLSAASFTNVWECPMHADEKFD